MFNLRRTTDHIINDNVEVHAWVEKFVRSGTVKQGTSGIIGLLGKERFDRVCVAGSVNGEDKRGMQITLRRSRRLCA